MTIKLSIIIVSWNTKELLRQCLESVISNLCLVVGINSPITEIIVVDNGSTDGSVEMAEEFRIKNLELRTKLIENKENVGFAKGNNIGIRGAEGEYIMLLNPDTIVKEGAIKNLVGFLDKNKKAAGVMPLLLNEDGSIQKDPIFLRFPSPLSVFFYYNSWLKKIALNFFPNLLFSVKDFSRMAEVEEVEQLSGAAMVVRGDILRSVGGLDERYPYYFEDVDLSYQLKKLGYKLFMDSEAKIVHLGGRSTQKLIEKEGRDKMYFLNFSSLFLFSDKNYSKIKSLMIKLIVLVQLMLKGKWKLVRKLFKEN